MSIAGSDHSTKGEKIVINRSRIGHLHLNNSYFWLARNPDCRVSHACLPLIVKQIIIHYSAAQNTKSSHCLQQSTNIRRSLTPKEHCRYI